MKNIIKNLNKKDWILIFIALAFIVLQVYVDLKLPEFTTNLTDMLNKGNLTTKKTLIQGGYLLLCAFSSALISIVIGYLTAIVGTRLAKTLREKVFERIQGYSMREIKKFSTASLITRTTNDVRQIQNFVAMGIQVVVKAPILAIWGIFKIIGRSWQISVVTFIAVAIISLSLITIMMFAIPRFKKNQKLIDNMNRVTRENLTGVKVVRAFNAEEYENEKFKNVNNQLGKNDVQIHRIMGLLNPIMNLVMNGLTLAVYTVVAVLINKAIMPEKFVLVSEIWLYTSWTMQIVSAFMMLIMIAMIVPRVLVSIKRVNEVLNTQTSIKDGEGVTTDIVGEVEFKNVSFHYPDTEEECLKNIDFKCKKGDIVAIIGATGSGKSTLINLIPRFYDCTEGEVLVDGCNVKDYKIEDLNGKIGYISQKAVLLKGDIAENVGLGNVGGDKPTDEQIVSALDIAQASDFVNSNKEGINYEITQGATNVSGGQKQRISIARALSRKPEILIFDDSFSALDYRTDKNLRARLKEEFDDTTCFIVAQRIGTIKNADLILVLENGEIVGKGKHEELLKNCEVYKEIALSQLNKEELNG